MGANPAVEASLTFSACPIMLQNHPLEFKGNLMKTFAMIILLAASVHGALAQTPEQIAAAKVTRCVTDEYSFKRPGVFDRSQAYFSAFNDPTSKTVLLSITGVAERSFVNPGFDIYRAKLVQNGRVINLAMENREINANTALAVPEPGFKTGLASDAVPEGVTRGVLISSLPSFFDLEKPISGIVFGDINYKCRNLPAAH